MKKYCNICADAKNYSEIIACNICDYECCKKCMKQYISTLSKDKINCMNDKCRVLFTRKTLTNLLGITYITKDFKSIVNKVRIDKQISLLSTFQEAARLEIQIEKESDELAKLMYIANNIRNSINSLKDTLILNDINKVKKTYIRPCSDGECNGFLNSIYKCELCNKITCKDCLEIIKTEDHICDPDTKATADIIKKDTKHCPTCGTGIYKIDGCFGENTEMLLWNGTIKKVQDIQVGDILIGDDGNPRNVLRIFNGEDNLYKVNQTNGISYVVNSKHELVLKFTGNNIIIKKSDNNYIINIFDINNFKRKKLSFNSYDEAIKKKLELEDYYKIKAEDFNNININIKKELCGFKSNNLINWKYKGVDIDPYILGVWIGDGDKTGAGISANPKDIEILEYVYEWCEKNNLEMIHEKAYKFRIRKKLINGIFAIGHGTTSDNCKGCKDLLNKTKSKSIICDKPNIIYNINNIKEKNNTFIYNLKKYNLINNKNIPEDFIINSEEVRLNIIAGIIDTDGWVGNNGKRIVIVQTNFKIVKIIELIAKSLGFYVNITANERINEIIFNKQPKNYQKIYKINISGNNINKIPTKLYRKKCNSSNYNKDIYKTQITVEPIGRGKYYGFELDNNNLFVLPDMTVVKNCDQIWCTLCQTAFSWKTGIIEQGRIHNPHYYEFLRNQANGEIPREEELIERFNNNNHCRVIDNTVLLVCTNVYRHNLNLAIRNIAKYLMDFIRYHNHLIATNADLFRQLVNFDEKIKRSNIDYLKKVINKDNYDRKIIYYENKKEIFMEKQMIMETLINTTNDIFMVYYDTYIYNINNDNLKIMQTEVIKIDKILCDFIEYCINEDQKMIQLYNSRSELQIYNYPKFIL